MGRIKTRLVKGIAEEIYAKHSDELSKDFVENKKVVMTKIQNPPKKMRNIVAGYLTRMKKYL